MFWPGETVDFPLEKEKKDINEKLLLSTCCHLKGKETKNKYCLHMRQNSIPTWENLDLSQVNKLGKSCNFWKARDARMEGGTNATRHWCIEAVMCSDRQPEVWHVDEDPCGLLRMKCVPGRSFEAAPLQVMIVSEHL